MLDMITENKLASTGVASALVGIILLVSAASMSNPDSDDDRKKSGSKAALYAIGWSLLVLGIAINAYDQYMRMFGEGNELSSFDMSSSEMSSSDLESFQMRVAAAASNLRKSMEEASSSSLLGGEESSAELAARASAQISSFIQNYS